MDISSRSTGSELRQPSLYQRILLARFWLPITIMGIVLFYQLTIVPLGDGTWRFWSVLLFYSIVGPAATFIILTWIASEVRERERAENELKILYSELQGSHALLGAIQHVTEQFASSPDLETTLSAASEGISKVTGAEGAALFFGEDETTIRQYHGISRALLNNASQRAQDLRRNRRLEERIDSDGKPHWVLSTPLKLSGKLFGSVHVYFGSPPSSEQRESFSILTSELVATVEATRSRTRDLLTLIEVDRSIKAEGNLERLLETLLSQMMTRADADIGGVYLADEDGLLQLKVCKGFTSPLSSVPLREGEGLIGKVASEREAKIIAHLSSDERDFPVLTNASSALALPFLAEGELLGIIVLADTKAMHFEETTLPFLNLVAGQVSLAVRNARAYLQSEELAIAEERARIAREIHDGVAQSLAFSALKLDLVNRLLKSDPSKAEEELNDTKQTLREMIKEVRRSIFALRPIDLERHGFTETIKRYLNDFGQQNDIAIHLDVDKLPDLSTKSEATLFRIFQEGLNNVAKHAGASEATIRLGTSQLGQSFVEIEDNGIGFDIDSVTDRVTSAGGLGLRQMKERIEGRGGVFELDSVSNRGTRLFASVPE